MFRLEAGLQAHLALQARPIRLLLEHPLLRIRPRRLHFLQPRQGMLASLTVRMDQQRPEQIPRPLTLRTRLIAFIPPARP